MLGNRITNKDYQPKGHDRHRNDQKDTNSFENLGAAEI
jgi:hypothetical protein